MSYPHHADGLVGQQPAADIADAPAHRARQPLDALDVVSLARAAGLLITLDGKLGNSPFQSVFGSLSSLERFAQAICESVAT
jgi:hypothetical protein